MPFHCTLHFTRAQPQHSSGPGTGCRRHSWGHSWSTAGGTAALPSRRPRTPLCRCALEARPVLSLSFPGFPLERSARTVKPSGRTHHVRAAKGAGQGGATRRGRCAEVCRVSRPAAPRSQAAARDRPPLKGTNPPSTPASQQAPRTHRSAVPPEPRPPQRRGRRRGPGRGHSKAAPASFPPSLSLSLASCRPGLAVPAGGRAGRAAPRRSGERGPRSAQPPPARPAGPTPRFSFF